MATVFLSWRLGVTETLVSLGPWFAVPVAVLVLFILIREALSRPHRHVGQWRSLRSRLLVCSRAVFHPRA
jgi:hypothetical protein